MSKVKEDLKEIYEYQIDSDYVKESLTDIKNNNGKTLHGTGNGHKI